MKIDIKLILIVVLSGLFLWSFSTCNKRIKESDALKLENARLDSMYNLKNQQLIVSQTEVATSQKAFRDATDSFFAMQSKFENKIKSIIAFYKGSTVTIIDSIPVPIPYVDSAKLLVWEDSIKQSCKKVIDYYEANFISVPQTSIENNVNYNIDLTATKTGIRINRVSIPDSQYIRFVELKGGFLKKDQNGKRHLFTSRSFQVQVIHTNPLIKTTSSSSVIYNPPKKGRWLEKAILVGAGIFLGLKL